MSILPVLAAICTAATPGGSALEGWLPVAGGELASVWMEPVLYEAPSVSDKFFVHLAVVNETEGFMGVDLRQYWDLIGPVQYVGTDEEELTVIDILSRVPPELTPERTAEILDDYRYGQLRGVAAGGRRDYYMDFNAAGRDAIDRLGTSYLFLALGG